MGNSCSCENAASEDKKLEGIQRKDSRELPSKTAQLLIGSLDSAPKYYVPQKPIPPSCYIIPEMSPVQAQNASFKALADMSISNGAMSLKDIESISKKHSVSANEFDYVLDGGEASRSKGRRKVLRRFKTNKEGITESIIPENDVHPRSPEEIKMIVDYFESHFVLGLIPTNNL